MTEWKEEKEKEKTTAFTDEKAGEEQWHPAEIQRRDIQKLLKNTKKLAGMYSDLLAIKREGWERMLKGKLREEEKKAQNG